LPAGELDAVLLDSCGDQASDDAYCASCWPRYRKVDSDQFRRLTQEKPDGR